jgi:predicted transcriptional regulator
MILINTIRALSALADNNRFTILHKLALGTLMTRAEIMDAVQSSSTETYYDLALLLSAGLISQVTMTGRKVILYGANTNRLAELLLELSRAFGLAQEDQS